MRCLILNTSEMFLKSSFSGTKDCSYTYYYANNDKYC